MIVISDTTPLISLIKIGQLNLLNHLFGEVQIPSAVFEELISNPRFPDESRQIRECPFIKKINVTDTNAVNLLRRSTGLDAGESEAIILSDSISASLLLMDEAKGREVAAQMGIQLMGTIGILLVANNGNLLLNIGPKADGTIPAEQIKRLEEQKRKLEQKEENKASDPGDPAAKSPSDPAADENLGNYVDTWG